MFKSKEREVVEKILSSYNYTLLDYYVNNGNSYIVFQNQYNYKGLVRLNNLIKQNGNFYFISKSNPHTLENISLWLILNNKSFKLYDDNIYNGIDVDLIFYCPSCNNCFYSSWRRISSGSGCYICMSLEYLKPDLAKQWIKSENNLTPDEVTISSAEKVYWCCFDCGNKWWATVDNRARNNSGCPRCANEQLESKIATVCKQYFKDNYNAIPEYKLLKNPKTNYWLKCDIYIPKNIYIEIHGPQHYKAYDGWYKHLSIKNNTTIEEEFEKSQYRDKIKREYCQENGIYIEVNLLKIKTSEDAIQYIENILGNTNE